MKSLIWIIAPALIGTLFLAGPASSAEKPGDVERAALGKVDFLVGDWVGEGWSLSPSGGRLKFWVKEFYHYRGNQDLMDMEGRFGDIAADGTYQPENEFGLGFLYYDRASGEYRMWHYSSDGTVFNPVLTIDLKDKSAFYLRKTASGTQGKFSLRVGSDGVWVTTFEVQRSDNSWLTVMEFRMKRVK